MKKPFLILLASFALSGCVNTTVVPVTTTPVQPLPITQNVSVFFNESEVKVPFIWVAAIDHVDPGKFQRVDLDAVIPVLKDKARAVGANGIIIDKQEQVVSGIFSRGIKINARAIKF
jgi:hypothetical protein